MKIWVGRLINIVIWSCLAIYATGSMIYLNDLFRVVSGILILAYIFKFPANRLSIVGAAKEFSDYLEDRIVFHKPTTHLFFIACISLGINFLIAPLIRHWAYASWGWDLGAIEQIIWNGSRGNGFTSTFILSDGADMNFFRQHLSIWLLAFSKIYRVLTATEFLLLAQSLCLVGTLWVFFKISRELDFSPPVSLFVVFLIWCFENFHRVNIWDFHENAFIPLFSALAYLYFLKKKYWQTAVFTILVGCFKEDAWVLAGFMAFYFCLENRKPWLGILFLILGVGIFIGYGSNFVEHISFEQRYTYLGRTPKDALGTLLHNPGAILSHLLNSSNLTFYLKIFLSGGVFWILGGTSIIPIIPVFFEIALSTYNNEMRRFENHYITPLLTPLFFAFLIGLKKVSQKYDPQLRSLLVISALALWNLKAVEPSTNLFYFKSDGWKNRSCYSQILSQIPDDSIVYSQDPFTSHLSKRRFLFQIDAMGTQPKPQSYAILKDPITPPGTFTLVAQDCGFKLVRF